MSFEKFEILKDRLRNFVHVNSQDYEELRDNLDDPEAGEVRAIFQAEWRGLMAGALSRSEYEALTDDEFEDDAEYQAYLAAIYGALGRQSEARSAVAELCRIYPGFTIEKFRDEVKKWNVPDDTIDHWVEALRKAGLPE